MKRFFSSNECSFSNSAFYLNYLDYECLCPEDKDPHERLNCFYLAMVEAISCKDYARAVEVYQDLVAKKEAFSPPFYPFQEEVQDLKKEIIELLCTCGLKASFSDLSF